MLAEAGFSFLPSFLAHRRGSGPGAFYVIRFARPFASRCVALRSTPHPDRSA